MFTNWTRSWTGAPPGTICGMNPPEPMIWSSRPPHRQLRERSSRPMLVKLQTGQNPMELGVWKMCPQNHEEWGSKIHSKHQKYGGQRPSNHGDKKPSHMVDSIVWNTSWFRHEQKWHWHENTNHECHYSGVLIGEGELVSIILRVTTAKLMSTKWWNMMNQNMSYWQR